MDFDLEGEKEYAEKFEAECKRKDELLALFEELENQNIMTKYKRRMSKKSLRRRFERIINDDLRIIKVSEHTLSAARPNGEIIKPIMINPQIATLVRPNDDLLVTLGFEHNQWKVIFVQAIGSGMGDESDAPVEAVH